MSDLSTPIVTDHQREIAAALEGGGMTHILDRPPDPPSLFWQVAIGVVGILSLLVGIVMVFFFTALGSIMVVMGAIICAIAFQIGGSSNHGASNVHSVEPT